MSGDDPGGGEAGELGEEPTPGADGAITPAEADAVLAAQEKAAEEEQAAAPVNLGRVDDPREPDIGNVGWQLKVEALMRAGIAYILLGFFGLTIVWSFLYAGTHSWTDTKQLLQIILPVETALLGSAVGYYFGTHKTS